MIVPNFFSHFWRYNYALQPMSKAAFVNLVAANQPETPKYFAYDAMLNRQERSTLDTTLERELTPLTLDEVLRRLHSGAQVVDVRDIADVAGAHLAGSLTISLSGAYATWAGSLLDHEKPIVIVAEPGREYEAAMRLGRIGYDNVTGYLDGGDASPRDATRFGRAHRAHHRTYLSRAARRA